MFASELSRFNLLEVKFFELFQNVLKHSNPIPNQLRPRSLTKPQPILTMFTCSTNPFGKVGANLGRRPHPNSFFCLTFAPSPPNLLVHFGCSQLLSGTLSKCLPLQKKRLLGGGKHFDSVEQAELTREVHGHRSDF